MSFFKNNLEVSLRSTYQFVTAILLFRHHTVVFSFTFFWLGKFLFQSCTLSLFGISFSVSQLLAVFAFFYYFREFGISFCMEEGDPLSCTETLDDEDLSKDSRNFSDRSPSGDSKKRKLPVLNKCPLPKYRAPEGVRHFKEDSQVKKNLPQEVEPIQVENYSTAPLRTDFESEEDFLVFVVKELIKRTVFKSLFSKRED